jgi:hypothetical protein
VLLIGIPSYLFFHEDPTCFDGVKNGDEAGVDCGGACELVCAFDAQMPIIHWDESFNVREGTWSAVAYVENPNNAYALNVPYAFKLLDSGGVLVAEKKGNAYIPPQQNFAIIEPAITVGNRLPSQEFFAFDEGDMSWIRADNATPNLSVSNVSLSERGGVTRLSASIFNPDTRSVGGIQATGILYDINGNAIAASETFIEGIAPNSSQEAIFTWPREVAGEATKKEVLYVVLP